ncbi:hypothetical protein H920_17390 [Fukomys damarensis]|uniref:Uncharacterized protein n=1 Tax=Fukomys damarensis TaxID=885580 RepID=A0A091CTF8_FUKDA|nr:hypothetical protein H920_17390 [Fukomys damarensis]
MKAVRIQQSVEPMVPNTTVGPQSSPSEKGAGPPFPALTNGAGPQATPPIPCYEALCFSNPSDLQPEDKGFNINQNPWKLQVPSSRLPEY